VKSHIYIIYGILLKLNQFIMGGKIKKGSSINRGYIGYHITWDGIKVFLRSKAEFIYARVLDYEKIPYKTECVRYTIGERTYKPDFFIFDAKYEKILKIVETKGLDDKQTALEYLNKYKPYFNSINIEYDVIWKYQALITKYNLHDDIENWISKSLSEYDFIPDSRGENNPMYGKTQSISTKKLIGDKCRERNLDPEYKTKCSNSQKSFYNSELGLLRRKQISEQKKLLYATRNPIIKKQCICCNTEFEQKLKDNGFCNFKCLRAWSYKNIPGYGKHKQKIIK
jgi:hypothetical protein